jgi:hypothetical protein
MSKKFFLLVISFFILTACGQSSNMFHVDSAGVITMLENKIKIITNLDEKDNQLFDLYSGKYKEGKNLSKDEKKIVAELFDVKNYYDIYQSSKDHDQKVNALTIFESQLKLAKQELNIQ